MRRMVAVIIMIVLAGTGLVVTGSPGAAAATAAAATPQPTPFALTAAGLGTRVKGGDVPASSGKTAYRVIGCTNLAPVTRQNHLAEATAAGLGQVSGMTTKVWTTARNGVVSSNSTHSLDRLVIKEEGFGRLVLKGITAHARVWHDKAGFHAFQESTVGSIAYAPPGEVLEPQELPTPNRTLEIPELATIEIGARTRRANADGARASATALKIALHPSGTTSRVAYARVGMRGGVKSGLFRGHSNATRVQALDGILSSGPNPFLPMPCQGTGGEVVTNPLAELNLGDQVVLRGLNTEQQSDQTRRKAWGYEKSSVSELNLGGGQLVIQDVFGKVNVVRKGRSILRNVLGTSFGSITANGEPKEFPPTGPLEIPGVAKIDRRLVEKVKHGIKVTSVRVTLLDGTGTPTGTVINLGEARLRIMPSGR